MQSYANLVATERADRFVVEQLVPIELDVGLGLDGFDDVARRDRRVSETVY